MGDNLNAYTWAYNCSIRYEMDVILNCHWESSKEKKFSKDVESVWDKHSKIIDILKEPEASIKVNHFFNCNIDNRQSRKNFFERKNPISRYWPSKDKITYKKNVVAFWSPLENASPPTYRDKNNQDIIYQKDPIIGKWDIIREYLEDFFIVKEISYRKPMEENIDILKECAFGIGYEGSAHQLFKIIWKPLIVFTVKDREKILHYDVPHAAMVSNLEEFIGRGHSYYVKKSKKELNKYIKMYKDYLLERVNPFDHSDYCED